MKKALQSLAIVASSCLFVAACTEPTTQSQAQQQIPQQVLLEGKTMGTTYSVKFYADKSKIRTQSFYSDIESILKTVNQQMSTYIKDSELSRFNRYTEQEKFEVSKDTAFVVGKAIEIGQQTQGALDVTVGPLINLWGFGAQGQTNIVPTEDELKLAKSLTGLDKLAVTENTLAKSQSQISVDLSAIAKGFGVDKVAEYLEEKGISSYLVEIGGEMRAKGKKPQGGLWRVAIEKPTSGERSVQKIINLANISIATSGDYRNYFEKDGKRFSHTIDPTTAKPITHNLASVTVLHPSAMMADGLATAMNVMGPEKALEFAKEQALAVFIIVKSADGFEVQYSPKFKPYLN
ncbi:FAD:protein FMN transferase [Catenovulum sp. SM1970]|uniref:FAD:protein FMN transferase n=1 Tax=Marinifaba aquimaris TaxID=2741323 RepID=UPI0015735650|nr:FAD:protein FMN transferase [Marinifaba aquimaris]NTS78300.1 FAD:protein FMN transferase [Marinifaba aquimaris]